MATISPQPRFRAFDSNGDPLNGGLLYTYAAGTTTPKATYTTEAGDVANANPVVLDSDGYADVWLGDGGYKFVLKTSADVTLWTVDDLGGTTSTAFGGAVNDISTNTNISSLYANSVAICTSSPTLSLLPAADAGEGFYISVRNNGVGTVTIDPDASETINGSATLNIAAGDTALIICDGDEWFTLFYTPVTVAFDDSTFRIQDNADSTKEIAFEASNITTGTTRTITVPDASGTLLYVGDVLDEDNFASDSAVYPPSQQSTKAYVDTNTATTYDTAVNTTSGTQVTITSSIPSTATKIWIFVNDVSGDSANSPFNLTLGDSGGEETTGYKAGLIYSASAFFVGSTTFFPLAEGAIDATDDITGVIKLDLADSSTNTWKISGSLIRSISGTPTFVYSVAGSKSLSAALTSVFINYTGTAFDSGSVRAAWK